MPDNDDILVAALIKKSKEGGPKPKVFGPSLRESSSLHTFVKTKEQGERLMKLLKLMEEGRL